MKYNQVRCYIYNDILLIMISADNVMLTECINRAFVHEYIMHAIYIIQLQAPGPALHICMHLQLAICMAQIATI